VAEHLKALFSSRRHEPTGFTFNGNDAMVDIDYECILAVDLPNGMKAEETIKLEGKSEFKFKDGKIWRLTDRS
jgi:hypothetical protein